MTEPTKAVQPPVRRPTVLVDFDGVIHTYSRGWADGTAYDPPMPGAADALYALNRRGYKVVVFSTRDADQITEWLDRYDLTVHVDHVTNTKEPAVAMIDDRAIRFEDWYQAMVELYVRYPVDSRPDVIVPGAAPQPRVTLTEQLPERAPWRCRVLDWHRYRFVERRVPPPGSYGDQYSWPFEFVYECAGCRLRRFHRSPTHTRTEYVRTPR